MAITVVQDTITWALYEDELRRYMELESPTTTRVNELLYRLFSSATQDADNWIDNPFDGTDEAQGFTLTGLTLESVKQGVFAWIYEAYYRAGPDGPVPGRTSVKTDANAEGFAASAATWREIMEAALDAAKPHWSKFQRLWSIL